MINKKVFFILPLLVFLSSAFQAGAAIISLIPQARIFGVGQEFSVDIKIDTEEVNINASQATIRFPIDVLELTGVEKTDSVFGFWLDEPKISNQDGTLIFTGGTTKGVSGKSLQILKMKFKAKAPGVAELSIQDTAVTASDGQGTNVLSTVKGANITISNATVVPAEQPITQLPDAGQPVEVPKKIIREPIIAKNLPAKPMLRVPLYPDSARWYNHTGEVMVFWDLPPDVVQVSTRLSKAPDLKRGEKDIELFTGKNFGILKEGIWYVRVQFRNNVGWGESAYYKISIDTTVPLPFDIKMNELLASDNPAPEIQFETRDAFSGISHALIFLDYKQILKSTSTEAVLPPLPPGKHTLLVRIFDLAGNSVESSLAFETLPLLTPTVDFVTKSVEEGELIYASGRALPDIFVDIKIFNSDGREVFKGTVKTNAGKTWQISVGENFGRGNYTLRATARDERGAMSYPSEPEAFRIKPKVIISIGFMELGWFEIFILAALIFLSGIGFALWYFISKQQTHEAYGIIAGRDVKNMTSNLESGLTDLEKLLDVSKSDESPERAKALHLLGKLHETIAKMKKYLGEEVNKLK
ncbi:MAG: cohesin domain-containing protein [bacterium]|nr:cohesin domain-containing protein [bacterium]